MPSATATGLPTPHNRSSHGLSGGQIAGIVVGAIFALLLLLLLLLCCLRRRRKQGQKQAVLAAATRRVSRSQVSDGSRGNYAALAAGTGAAGLGTAVAAGAAAASRGSLGSDEWEEDHLTSGGSNSGFFVVGGRRLGTDRRASMASRRSRGSANSVNAASPTYSTANVAPSSSSRDAKVAGLASVAAAGAAFFGAAFGRNRKAKDKAGVDHEEEHPLSDDDLGDGSMAERRGLMPLHDSSGSEYGSGTEMREASPRVVGPAAALLGASGAAAYFAGRHGNDGQGAGQDSPLRAPFQPGPGALPSGTATVGMSRPPSSGAFSGSGSSSHATGGTGSSHTPRVGGAATMSSSNSTGGFTTSGGSGSGSGTSLPPPPRAPRNSPQSLASTTLGNIAPSSGSPFASSPPGSDCQNRRFSTDTTDSATSGLGGLNPALLGLSKGAALGGLATLAAGHRGSGTSTFSLRDQALSSDVRASHASGMSQDELRHLRATDPERYSRFISAGSNLLGPDYQPSPDIDVEPPSDITTTPALPVEAGTLGPGTSVFGSKRLATIPSVSEFGEKSENDMPASQSTGEKTTSTQPTTSSIHAVSAHSGSLGAASSGSARIVSPLPIYEQQQIQGGESLPMYQVHDPPAGAASPRRPSEAQMSQGTGRFVTPPDSPRNFQRTSAEYRQAETSQVHQNDAAARQQNDEIEGASGAELAEAGAASAGILSGMAAGWRRLTMGQYAWIPGTSSPSQRVQQTSSAYRDSTGDLDYDVEGRISHDTQALRASEESSRLMHSSRHASRFEASEVADLAPEVRSQRASVYEASAFGHGTSGSLPAAHSSSKEASGSSGEQARNAAVMGVGAMVAGAATSSRQRSYPSLSSQHSSTHSRGGYATSHSNSLVSGRHTTSGSSGLDSLSARAQLSSRSTGSASTRSGYHSSSRSGGSRRTGASLGSGASTGAASYSPSDFLSRGNTTSTRGMQVVDEATHTADPTSYALRGRGRVTSSIVTDMAEPATSEGEFTSSRATGGSSSLEQRKRPRSSSVDGPSHLDSLHEDPFGDAEVVQERPAVPPPSGGHYPSDSLGAAVSRTAARQELYATPDDLGRVLPQRTRIRSLQPGTSAPAPTALAPSLSTPSLGSVSNVDVSNVQPEHSQLPSTGSGAPLSGVPASASWRPSPRVASASSAAEAQAALLRAQEQRPAGPRSMRGIPGEPAPPRSHAGSPSVGNRRASYNLADLDAALQQQSHIDAEAVQGAEASATDTNDEADTSNRSFGLGKFLRF